MPRASKMTPALRHRVRRLGEREGLGGAVVGERDRPALARAAAGHYGLRCGRSGHPIDCRPLVGRREAHCRGPPSGPDLHHSEGGHDGKSAQPGMGWIRRSTSRSPPRWPPPSRPRIPSLPRPRDLRRNMITGSGRPGRSLSAPFLTRPAVPTLAQCERTPKKC